MKESKEDRVRRRARIRKRKSRAKLGTDGKRLKRAEGILQILCLEFIMSSTEPFNNGNSCRKWTGRWRRMFGEVEPFIEANDYAGMNAQLALFIVTFGRKPKSTCVIRTTCGVSWCMEPTHLMEKSKVKLSLERKLNEQNNANRTTGND